jgi:predicted permease
MHAFLQDFRYSWRQLRKSPGFALTAILTLALGVGANVVVFSVVNGLILRPLNVPDARNLYTISRKPHGWDSQSYPDYVDYRDKNTTFSGIAGYGLSDAGLSVSAPGASNRSVTQTWGYIVSGNYFDMLGIRPELGRLFHPSDEHGPNSAPYIVVSYGFWHDRLNGDPHAIGTVISLNKHPFTMVGVAPKDFHGTELFYWPDFWIPIVNEQQIEGYDFLTQRGNHTINLLGRLKPGVTPRQADENLNAIAQQLSGTYKEDDKLDARLVKPGLMGDALGAPMRAFLSGVMLLSLLVLVAACANLASIFAARAADRSRELAIRLAIGSSRWHMVRQLLAESITVSLLGGAVGTIVAQFLLQTLSRWQPIVQVPIHVVVSPDPVVYAVALGLSLASGIIFGLLPARQIWRIEAAHSMKSGAAALTTPHRFTLRDILLGLQITICTLLVTASLVAFRGMMRSLHASFGFNPAGVTLLDADMSLAGHTDEEALPLQKQMLEQTAHIPGVTAVGIIDHPPLGLGNSDSEVFRTDTTDYRRSTAVLDAVRYLITPGYLNAAGTHLFAGRDFTWHDDEKAPRVAIVNATFAHTMFGNVFSAIGQRFRINKDNLIEIVGVVENGKYRFLTEDDQPAMFFPLAQVKTTNTVLAVRSQALRAEVAPALQRIVNGVDANLPYSIQSRSESLEFALFPSRAATAALGVMGLLAAMLAITGIFGMAAYSVSKRMKELGIRVALGAQPLQLMKAALARPVILLLAGSIAGLVLGVLASGLLAHIVYEATPHDPLVLSGVILTMMLLGAIATWVPARRAQTVDPALLLREE